MTTSESISISCDECALDGTDACDGCVVSFLLGVGLGVGAGTGMGAGADEPRTAMVVDVAEARAMRLLHGAGLVPGLRYQRRVS